MQSLFHALPKTSSCAYNPRFIFKTVANGLDSQQTRSIILASKFRPLLLRQGTTSSGSCYQPRQNNYHLLTQSAKPILPLTQETGVFTNQVRTVTKFSLRKGKRKTVKAVVERFYRLDWGIWIRPKSGRHHKLWKKGKLRRKRLRQHVFTNAWHTRTLERMTTKYWHKKKYFVDDPYESYHKRDNFAITKNTRNIKDQLV